MARQSGTYAKSLQGKINISLLFIVAAAVVSFMVISINQSRTAVRNTAIEYTSQLIEMMNESIDSYITNMESIARVVAENSDVRSYLFSETENEGMREEHGRRAAELFQTLSDTGNDICNIGIISDSGRYLINDTSTLLNPYAGYEETEWYTRALLGEEVITSSHVQNIVNNEFPWVVTLSREIPGGGADVEAVLFVDLNFGSISRLCEKTNLGTKGYVFIMDEEGNLIYHPRQRLIYSGLWEEEFTADKANGGVVFSEDGQKLYTVSRSEVTGWTMVGVTYLDEMMSRTDRLRNLFYLMAIVLVGVALTLSIFLTDMITMPLRRLRGTMKVVENGNFDVEVEEPDTGDEISDLFRSFRNMILKIRELVEQNTAEQREKRKSELNALQAQINPHFLYNTLDSIIWMAEAGDRKNVVLMTSALAKLLRKSISNRNEMVTLEEEIEYTRSYLIIQKMRYVDKLEYEMDVESAILQMEVVKLIVQPLVENAIYHGIKYKEGKGLVRIEGGFGEDQVVLRIIDNGVGMTKTQLAHVFDERETDTRRNGVGVLNVHRRIRLHYGGEYGLSFESAEGEGTTVSIHLPLPDPYRERRSGTADAEGGFR